MARKTGFGRKAGLALGVAALIAAVLAWYDITAVRDVPDDDDLATFAVPEEDPSEDRSSSAGEAEMSTALEDSADDSDPETPGGSADDAAEDRGEASSEEDLVPPVFDLVRVGPDGDTVVSGSAPSGFTVTIELDGSKVAMAPTDASGTFAALFDIALGSGAQVMEIVARGDDGAVIRSEQSVILTPPPGETPADGEGTGEGELLADGDAEDGTEDQFAGLEADLPPSPGPQTSLAGDTSPDDAVQDDPAYDLAMADPLELAALPEDPVVSERRAADDVNEAPGVLDAPEQELSEADTPVTELDAAALGDTVPSLAESDPEDGETLASPPEAGMQGDDLVALVEDPAAVAPEMPVGREAQSPGETDEGEAVALASVSASGGSELDAAAAPPTEETEATAAAAPEPERQLSVAEADPEAAPDRVAQVEAPAGSADRPEAPLPEATRTMDVPTGETQAEVQPRQPVAESDPETALAEADEAPADNAARSEAPLPDAERTSRAPTVLLASDEGVSVLQPGDSEQGQGDRVVIDAISYGDDGEVLLEGRTAAHAGDEDGDGEVRIYVDNRPVERVAIAGDGSWRTPLPGVDPGTYTVRVDQVGGGGSVVSRFETPFRREAPSTIEATRIEAEEGNPDVVRASVITVQPGYTLWGIASDRYGSGYDYVQIFEQNRDQIRDPDLIYPGQVFDLPKADPPADDLEGGPAD
ncbi:LysM peptidoglycan-binding domain-containing protein [Tropicimonas sp. IMCC34011]|uniref:LysM peptidoglycan-binding domain-containing protein n=1 Tax=Tropicimonas sp. IMCC34011 TaxID=2248759 RepID=UPI000E2816FC|nr:LysM peptidoglycan-binding domain-containing protein [Tropicimonas sp. IMCC34011]